MLKSIIKIRTPLFWAAFSTVLIPLYMFTPVRPIHFDAEFVYADFFAHFREGHMYGLTEEWVYPSAALIPVIIAGYLGVMLGNYLSGWVVLVSLLNFLTVLWLGVNKNFHHKHYLVMTVFALSLSGVFYYRLDFVAACLAVWAYMLSTKNKQLAYVLIMFAALIKIWPAALAVGLWLMSSHKIKDAVLLTTYGFVLLLPSLLLGGLNVAFSFITGQSGRGIQIESVFAVPLFMQGYKSEFNAELITVEISGFGSDFLSTMSTVMLFIVLVAVFILGVTKYWNTPASQVEAYIFVNIILLSFVLFNKVGSPQFSLWVLVSLLFVLEVFSHDFLKKYVLAAAVSVLASGVLYPYLYTPLEGGDFFAVMILSVKHSMVAVLVAMLVKELIVRQKETNER